jgi:hypothetical protein
MYLVAALTCNVLNKVNTLYYHFCPNIIRTQSLICMRYSLPFVTSLPEASGYLTHQFDEPACLRTNPKQAEIGRKIGIPQFIRSNKLH